MFSIGKKRAAKAKDSAGVHVDESQPEETPVLDFNDESVDTAVDNSQAKHEMIADVHDGQALVNSLLVAQTTEEEVGDADLDVYDLSDYSGEEDEDEGSEDDSTLRAFMKTDATSLDGTPRSEETHGEKQSEKNTEEKENGASPRIASTPVATGLEEQTNSPAAARPILFDLCL